MSLPNFMRPLHKEGNLLPEIVQDQEKSSEEEAERWVLALAGQLLERLPLPRAETPPSAWRARAGELTVSGQSAVSSGAQAGSGDTPSSTLDQRMVVRVNAGDLGELVLSVDRAEGGLRVQIGVQNAAAQAAVSPERGTLAEVLRQSGMTVQSVSVVQLSQVGPNLAFQGSRAVQMVRKDSAPSASENSENERRRHVRKLNLKG